MRYLRLMCLFVLVGCSSSPRPPPAVSEALADTELRIAPTVAAPLMNISLHEFASPLALDDSIYLVDSQLRSVEARLIPFKLRQTLQRSGYWGAVRLMPGFDPAAELQLEGAILASSGTELKLSIKVTDAAGRRWLEATYTDAASDLDYIEEPDLAMDPFQDLYNRVANDLSLALATKSETELNEIASMTTMRYAAGLASHVFSGYLRQEAGGLVLAGLPARDDPLFQAVQRVREAEYLFTDAVDEHYQSLHRQVGPTYAWWRYYNHELLRGNERLERIDATRGATKGSWYAVERVYKTFKDAKMNQDALRELTDSFDRETAPVVTEVAGRVVELSGSLQQQYALWRSILKDMYLEEIGR
ncbi:MAG: hypothetical protein ACPGPD_04500 [Pseudomonadales bacterium]